MKPASYQVLSIVLLFSTAGLAAEAARKDNKPVIDETRQLRTAFLEGVLFTAGQQEAELLKPPVAFNTKDVLAGIKAIEVVIEDLPPALEQYGLQGQALKTEIERQLGRSRIEIIAEQPAESAPAENLQDTNEPPNTLMQAADIESESDFLEFVQEHLQKRRPRSQSAILDITVTGVVDEAAGFASYSIHGQLLQEVVLLREDPRRSLATTWQIGTVGYTAIDQLDAIVEQIRKIVDQFTADYLDANPETAARARGPQTKTTANGVVAGIIRSEDRSSAVIGIKIVREGDIIDGVTVVKISADKVEFEKDNQRWTQGINDPPAPQWK